MYLRRILSTTITLKVPEITVLFWAIKLLTTALGESVSDHLVHQMDPVIAVLLGAAGFALAIALQLLARRYIPWIYWLAVTMVAVFGTMAADVVHIVLKVPYFASALFFAAGLVAVFVVWYKTEKTLSIHSILTSRRELFYWETVIVTFALGTATGDLTAITFHLGYLVSGVVFAILFLIPFVAYRKFGLSEVISFWFAYIVTRPFGASFADWFGRTPASGGIGFGTGNTSLVLAALIVGLVGYLSFARAGQKTVFVERS